MCPRTEATKRARSACALSASPSARTSTASVSPPRAQHMALSLRCMQRVPFFLYLVTVRARTKPGRESSRSGPQESRGAAAVTDRVMRLGLQGRACHDKERKGLQGGGLPGRLCHSIERGARIASERSYEGAGRRRCDVAHYGRGRVHRLSSQQRRGAAVVDRRLQRVFAARPAPYRPRMRSVTGPVRTCQVHASAKVSTVPVVLTLAGKGHAIVNTRGC